MRRNYNLTLSEYQDSLSRILQGASEDEFIPLMRYLCRTDLFFLLRHGCNRKDMDHPWLFERCREVQRTPNFCLDLWARYHYKSTIITFGKSIQDILASHGDDPLPEWEGYEVTIGLFSHNRPMAKDFLRQIKHEFEKNVKLKSWFPDILFEKPENEAPKWNEDAGLIVKRKSNPKEATVEAAGVVEGQPTGKHYLVRVYDDVVHAKYVTNAEIIKKTTDAWDVSQNLGDTKFNLERYVGTRYHKYDTYAEIMKRGIVTTRVHTATIDGTANGTPVFLTQTQLDRVRQGSSPFIFACQQLLNPLGDEEQTLQESWLRYYDYKPNMESSMNRYIVCDPASSKKKGSDYTVIWVLGLAQDGNIYQLDLVRDRLKLSERWETLLYLHKKWRPLDVGYEKYSMQCDKEHFEIMMAQQNYRFNITELGGQVNKVDRIKKMVPELEAGRFYLQEQMLYRQYDDKLVDLIKIFKEEEYLAFPVGLHDDMLDALARIKDEDLFAMYPKINSDSLEAPKGLRDSTKKDRYRKKVKINSGWGA